jgi:hypothetical protein
MFDRDFVTFDRAFGRVCGAYRLKVKPTEAEELTRTYFKVLDAWPLDDVLAAGKKCMAKCKRFPAVADWVAELPATVAHVAPAELRLMSVDEMDAHERAAAMRYQDEACGCPSCFNAFVHERPLRFVPTLVSLVDDTYERAFNTRRHQVEVLGHWAHGEELARWYAARDHFFGLGKTMPRLRRLVALTRAILEREPGMEG